MLALVLIACSLIACSAGSKTSGPADTAPADTAPEDSPPEDTGSTDTAAPEWASCDGAPVRTTCPDDALVFPVSDSQNVQSLELSWRWSSACFMSVADPVYLSVPDDAASLTVTVDAGTESTEMDLLQDGALLPDPFAVAGSVEVSPAFTRSLPLTPSSPAVAGCWAVFPRSNSTTPDTLPGRLDAYVRRGDASTGTVRVVGIIVDEAPMTEEDVADVLAIPVATYAVGGLTVELAATETLSFHPGERLGTGDDRRALLSSWTDPNDTQAIPIFFINEYDTSGTIGIAGGIPGAPRPGTASSGVTVAVAPLWDLTLDGPDLEEMGQVVTHELGHQLGLRHTSERDGATHDLLADTPECTADHDDDGDGSAESAECEGSGADHVMFWQSRGYDQTVVTEDQRWIVARTGAVRED
jgi:hypothetical protein